MSITLTGSGISHGIAIGHVHLIEHTELEICQCAIPDHLIENEVTRFANAITQAQQQLKDIRNSIPKSTRADIVAFIDTHLLMMKDSMLTVTPVKLIREHRYNAEWALQSQRDSLALVFDEMNDPYLRTRKDDIDHVVTRIQRILLGKQVCTDLQGNEKIHNAIVFAHDLTPADTVLLQHQGIAGFVTESGGPLSHTAILARSLGIPAIVGTHTTSAEIREGETVILDGGQGTVTVNVDDDTLENYRRLQHQYEKRQSRLEQLRDKPALTLDGTTITLCANIELTGDVESAQRVGAEGIGLYRTEFLFMNRRDLPDEEEQFHQYCSVVDALQGKPLTIRTLDLGADKNIRTQPEQDNIITNPALGLRAIRLCLKNPALFHPQLRAILRTSAQGPVSIMIPMLSSAHELREVLALIETIKKDLRADGLAYDPDIRIGGMIEVPAAALSASLFARQLDFLSIGTNDLIQYTLAIDRIDDEVTYLYDPLHPAVLSLIKIVIDAGQSNQVPISMCGEMAGDPRFTRLLLAMGLTDFSMHPATLPEIKDIIQQSDISRFMPIVTELLDSDEPDLINEHLNRLNQI